MEQIYNPHVNLTKYFIDLVYLARYKIATSKTQFKQNNSILCELAFASYMLQKAAK
jgi:hypothetical protein